VIYSQCTFFCDDTGSAQVRDASTRNETVEYLTSIMKLFLAQLGKDGLTVRLSDAFEKT
jgi:hypothetical protein